MAKATERLLLPMIRLELPEITDVNLLFEGIFQGCAVISLDKRHPGHTLEIVEKLWSRGWLADARLLVVVDADIDVQDLSLITWKVLNIVDWRRDLMISAADREAIPLGRLALDATRKMSGAGNRLEIARGREVMLSVDNRWQEFDV